MEEIGIQSGPVHSGWEFRTRGRTLSYIRSEQVLWVCKIGEFVLLVSSFRSVSGAIVGGGGTSFSGIGGTLNTCEGNRCWALSDGSGTDFVGFSSVIGSYC